MNLAYKFPTIFWNCACLIVDSGGVEVEDSEEDGGRNYDKIALALNKMKNFGIEVKPPNINVSKYTFSPNIQNNTIEYGINGLTGIGEDVVYKIINNRPYSSMFDLLKKVNLNKSQMVTLIKSGALDEFGERRRLMVEYLWYACDKKKRLTLQNLPSLIKFNLLPITDEYEIAYKIYEFNRYLKSECYIKKSTVYNLDDRALQFLYKQELCINDIDNNTLNIKKWDNVYQSYMNLYREWIAANKDKILDELNTQIFLQEWNKYGNEGNISAWEMESICYYFHEHELANVDKRKYGISNFFDLPEEPIIDTIITKGDKKIPLYKLNVICGTCIGKNKIKSTVTLLTPEGVVNVKMRKEYFNFFNQQISRRNADGTKTIIEKSWFNRGNMLLIQGIRRGEEFIPKKYAHKGNPHQLYRIDKVHKDGTMELRNERFKGDMEEDE